MWVCMILGLNKFISKYTQMFCPKCERDGKEFVVTPSYSGYVCEICKCTFKMDKKQFLVRTVYGIIGSCVFGFPVLLVIDYFFATLSSPERYGASLCLGNIIFIILCYHWRLLPAKFNEIE